VWLLLIKKREDFLIRTGVDVSQYVTFDNSINGNDDKYEYLLRNLRPGKQFPGGPSCQFHGKEIPIIPRKNRGTKHSQ
jgi:hypothetical protein